VTNANVIIFLLALQGLCGAEIVGRRSVGASEGFLGWVAYLVRHNTVIYKSKIEKRIREQQTQVYHYLFLFSNMAGMHSLRLF